MATMSSYKHQPMIEQEQETENSTENSSDTPLCTASNDTKIASTSSSKRRRAAEKRVISVPIKDIEGFRVKGDHMSAPPSDSWAWRKYGQKPIKGSPYPRGYYRCSSSKGCPARKQVERSRSDPNLLLITYSCEHNHSSPMANSRNHHHQHHHHHHHSRNSHVITHSPASVVTETTTAMSLSEEDEEEYYEEEEEDAEKKPVINDTTPSQQSQEQAPPAEYKFAEGAGEFGWFDFEATAYCTMLDQCPILTDEKCSDTDSEMAAMIFTRGEEEESLFADLGELPECSKVFRREMDWREVAA